jgi:eukaryotic-like serine/threonine-protein kinase
MKPERWREIERLYHAAIETGPAALTDADPELRHEVEQLLAQGSDSGIPARSLDSAPAETTATSVSEGRTISHYRIVEKLGAGGMGVVYKAFDDRLGRMVALKFLPPHLRQDRKLKEGLAEEARAASALDHPNIVVIHEIDETKDGDLFIAMALHEGTTLRHRMAAGLPVKEALQIARQIASGLARAHENGIFHRDIKPSNIIVDKDGIARIIDFGLAKTSDATITAEGSAKGTPLYMSPEQASGKAVDRRTDLWSLGAVLYEMLAGKPPFPGGAQLQVMHAIVNDAPPKLRDVRPELPAGIDAIVSRALEKDPAKRYQSAADIVRDVSSVLTALEAPYRPHSRARRAYSIGAACLVLAAAGVSARLYWRSEQRHWAREQAIPQISRVAEKQPVSAFLLLQKAERILPGDAQLARLETSLTLSGSVETAPPGAAVEIQDYLSSSGPWLPLGTTPLAGVRRPKGYFRWRFSRPGTEPFVAAPLAGANLKLLLPTPETPAGMVPVPAGRTGEMIDFVGWIETNLPAFDIDRFEVTNSQYQQFVDQGGYQKPEYWKERFFKDGKDLSREQAMEMFRDSTGRYGPSTWEGGHFPPGQDDYPVSGVSWYEASAYAAFAGKSLPALMQWYVAAPSDLASYAINQGNFGRGPVPVESSGSVGPYGTYGMAGNVREWCLNAVDQQRFILGGAWRTQTYLAYDPEALSPFDRSDLNGIRCVRNHSPLPPDAAAAVVRQSRDFARVKPVSDDVFQTFRVMYDYDHNSPPAPQGETTVENIPDWTKEKLTIDAGYEDERLPVYLFLPKHIHPPFQAVVFFPSARVNDMPSSDVLGDMDFIDYIIQSGRALLYPVYTGTYERNGHREHPGAIGDLDRVIKDSKEVRRSVDYLVSRPDIDKSKIAYLGVSQGSAEGVMFTALEDRFRAVIFLDGGFFLNPSLPAKDQVNFVTRLKKPVLMVNGRYDFTFSPERAQVPMFRMLGTPAADKRYVPLDAPHDVSQRKVELSREVLAWLDQYLGRVN